jgi:hypothetical protein
MILPTLCNRSTNIRTLCHKHILSDPEDIEVARAARAANEVIKGKGKRGRKRKSAALEVDEPETQAGQPKAQREPEVARG